MNISYIRACKLTGVGWVRERWYYMDGFGDAGESQIEIFKEYRDAGLKILMCTHGSNQQAPENLFDSYETTKKSAQSAGDYISAWELGNEPDLIPGEELRMNLPHFTKPVHWDLRISARI